MQLNRFSLTGSTAHERRKQMVYETIRKNNDVGMNELHTIMLKKSDPSMAKPTLVKIVHELIGDGLVANVKEGKQRYRLTTDFDYATSMNELVDTFESILFSHEEKLAHLETATKGLPILQKAYLLVKFLQMIQATEWKFMAASSGAIKHHKLDEQRKRLEKLKAKLLARTLEWSPRERFPVMLLMNKIEGAIEMKMSLELDAFLENK